MAGFCVTIAALALVGTAAGQDIPSIEANGVDITIDAPAGDVLINMRGREGQPPVSLTEMMNNMATMTSNMATMTSQMTEMSSMVQQLQQQLDPDNNNTITGWRNDIESRVGQLPTDQTIADQYLTSAAAGTTYETQTVVNRVRADLNVLVAAAADDEFPLCDALRVPVRGNTTDHEEHVPGTVVGISCNRGNALTGASEAICLSNATWAYRGAVPTCRQCTSRWLDVPWALNRWENIQGNGAGRGHDFRTGNPGGSSSFNLPAVAIGNGGVTGLRFYFQYVTGYGRCQDQCTNNPPGIQVYVADADDDDAARIMAWDSDNSVDGVRLDGQGCPQSEPDAQNPNGFQGGCDYDTCGQRGGWGNDDDGNDGCYSQRIYVNRPNLSGLTSATRAKVVFEINNRDRNMHINEDLMNMQVLVQAC